MTYDEIILKIKGCSITDGEEFDLFIDDVAIGTENLNLSITQREHLIEQLITQVEGQPEPEYTSWSLVHFIETLDEDNSTNYRKQLLESLKRKPKFLTLLLANRILNVLPGTSTDRILCLTTLKEIATEDAFDEYVRNQANEFYEYQLKKRAEN
jgi:hypothetical protein